MRGGRFVSLLGIVAMLSACGGGGGGSGSVNAGGTGSGGGGTAATPTPAPAPVAGCSLRERQNWAAGQLNEWYLFPETLPAALDPSGYASVDAYIDALTATARAQRRDRFFTYLTSIAEENAFFNSGSSAGFGVRLAYDTGAARLFVSEAFEGAPALAAGIDRGTEIVGIGTTAGNIRTVSAIFASGGGAAVTDALGPSTPGTTRVLRVTDAAGTREVSVAKTDFAITPVSSRYGAKVIDDGGRRVGYLNLRTFITTADPALRQAFQGFRQQGVTEIIVDFRYNGGGLISIAELMGDLLGANRSPSDVFGVTTFRPSKASQNSTRFFRNQAEAIAPTRIAFIGTGGTASASELVINGFVPYLNGNMALVGTNTFGKPVGQIARDKPECDDRLRIVALAVQNSAGNANYYDGLATTVPVTCRAGDDIAFPLGDPREASTRAALDFLAGRACTPIAGSGGATASARTMSNVEGGRLARERELIAPERPTPAQREVPGLF